MNFTFNGINHNITHNTTSINCPVYDATVEKIVIICYGGIISALLILGIFGNFFSFTIFSEMATKGNLGVYYLKYISLLDLVVSFLLIKFPIVYIARKYDIAFSYSYHHVLFRADAFIIIINTFMKASSLLVLVVSLERYLFLYNLTTHDKIFRKKLYKYYPTLCFLLSLIINGPYATWNVVLKCFDQHLGHIVFVRSKYIENETGFLIYQFFRELLLSVIPIFSILFMNFKLLIAFKRYYFSNKSETTTCSDQTNSRKIFPATDINQKFSPNPQDIRINYLNQPAPLDRVPSSMQSSGLSIMLRPGRRILLLLFASVVSYLIFVSPITFLIAFYPVWTNNCQQEQEPCLYRTLIYIFNTLEACHYTLNFYLYLVADPKFKKMFVNLIKCKYLDMDLLTT
ncbi:unnamed protein product [Gordionus sp. m RMFG-2023]